MHQILQSLVDVAADPDLVAKVVFAESDLQHKINLLDTGMVVGWSGVVHRLPFLTVEQCAAVLALGTQYDVNPEEDGPYQIPECVLPEFDGSFIDDWTVLAYQGKFRGNWQLAKYTDGETGFHHDMDSELTVVINLTPSASGGTGIRTACHRETEIGALPVGHGLMFNGRMVHHRGLRCYGTRNLLVGWLHKVDFEDESPIPIHISPEVIAMTSAVNSVEDEYINAGLTFNTQAAFVGVAAGAEALIGVVTGADGMTVLGQGYNSTGVGVTVSLYEIAFSGGTDTRTVNRNLGGPAPTMIPKQGVTATPVTAIIQTTFTAIAAGQQAQLALVQDFQRLVLKPNTSYVIGLKNNDAGVATISSSITWRRTRAAFPK